MVTPEDNKRRERVNPHWRCFFCDEVFTTRGLAAEHFGTEVGCDYPLPACQIKAHEGHLVTYIRKLEEELGVWNRESHQIQQAILTLEGEVAEKERRAEEDGYARGVADMRSRAFALNLRSTRQPMPKLDIPVADRDRPSRHGKLFGETLAEIAAEGRKHATAFSFEMCLTCAFREGCMTNQSAATGIMALNCLTGIDPDDFACHHGMKDGGPTKLCAGYLAAKLAPFEFTSEALMKMMARLDRFEGPDQVRADYDAWQASIDPEGKMDAYQLARAYAVALP